VGEDAKFLQDRARMMSEFGEIYQKVAQASGRGEAGTLPLDRAREAYSESLQIFERLSAKEPKEIAWQRGIADQTEHLGKILQLRGQLELALESFRRTLEMRRAILDRQTDATSHSDLAWSHYNIGEIFVKRGMPQESLESHNDALANMQRALLLGT
jgi:tetratricopeptide (TPR) repeat protein